MGIDFHEVTPDPVQKGVPMKVTFKGGFKRRKIPELLVFAQNVLECYRKHPALQGPKPDFLPTDVAVEQAITSLGASYAAGLGGDRDSKKQRNLDLDVLVGHLETLAHFYETAGVQNPALLLNTGFEAAPVPKSAVQRALEAVALVTLTHGTHPGIVYAKVPRVRYAKGYEVYYTEGDPTVEENWKFQATHYTSSMEIGGLEGGKIYSFKIRAANSAGKGPFSPIGTIRAL
jgi:hypothetical protein